MPLADLTAVANLALSHLGEPFLTDYATDTGTTADWVRLHLPQCRETVLEGHVWSFATRCSQLAAVPLAETNATGTIGVVDLNTSISFTAVEAGPSGNEITVAIAEPDGSITEPEISINSHAIVVTPANTGDQATATIAFTDFPANNDTVTINGRVYTFTTAFFPTTYQIGINALPFLSQVVALTVEVINGTRVFPASIANGDVTAAASGDNVILTSILAGAAGNDLTLTESAANTTVIGFAGGTDDITTAAEAITALTADTAAALLVTAVSTTGSDGTGELSSAIAAVSLSGGTSTSSVYAPAYGSAFNLPSDCLRVLKIDTEDIDIPRNDFEIQGRHLLLQETLAEAPVIHYIANSPPVDEWPTTFTDAVAFLLAARLARLLTQNGNTVAEMMSLHEAALGKARSKDTRETRSKENHGPRQMAARSGLVNARYNSTALPPYA